MYGNMQNVILGYSVLKLFTGLAMAAFTVIDLCKNKVFTPTSKAERRG